MNDICTNSIEEIMRSFAKANLRNHSKKKLLAYEDYLRRRRWWPHSNSTTTSYRYILQGINWTKYTVSRNNVKVPKWNKRKCQFLKR